MSVLYTGTTFNFYINGQPIGSATDSNTPTISNGWLGLCADSGSVKFQTAQDYKATGS
jgi:hypothetical protein